MSILRELVYFYTIIMESYKIKIQQFEGPFDLLLFFIERDELDIHDIPIASITNDFLTYIKQLEELNLDVASEFILMAATLMRIKSRMLIPRKEIDEQGNEIDPRQELAERLLEYRRYKEIIDDMKDLEELRSKKHARGGISKELKMVANRALVDIELESLSLYKLLQTFHGLLENYENRKNKTIHHIVRFSYSVKEQQDYIRTRLKTKGELRFEGLFRALENRVHAIVTFLALLEMLNMEQVEITQGEGLNNFWIKASK